MVVRRRYFFSGVPGTGCSYTGSSRRSWDVEQRLAPPVSWVGQRPQQFARTAATMNRANNSDPEQLPVRPTEWTARTPPPAAGANRRAPWHGARRARRRHRRAGRAAPATGHRTERISRRTASLLPVQILRRSCLQWLSAGSVMIVIASRTSTRQPLWASATSPAATTPTGVSAGAGRGVGTSSR